MKYDMKKFNSAVSYYKRKLGKISNKTIQVTFDLDDADAYYSIAPLSRAVHDLGGDLIASGFKDRSPMLDALSNTWNLYEDMKKGAKDENTRALKDFITAAEKKAKGFSKIFKRPEMIVKATGKKFSGTVDLAYRPGWFKQYKWNLLLKTAGVIYKEVYNLRRGEKVAVGFQLVLGKKDLDKPIEDFLDSFAISRAMMTAARPYGRVTMGASSPRYSMLAPANRVNDLRATLLGCELSKDIGEPVFKKFRKLSGIIGTDKVKVADANFFISGKGYPGKHLFGNAIGYPDPDRRTRWQAAGGFIYKLDFYPQTRLDRRKPMSRVGFTDTLPLDIFIRTCNVDWYEIKRKNDVLKRIAEKSEKIIVRSNIAGKYVSNFEVGLVKEDGGHRWARGSDIDIRHKIQKEYLKRTGIVAGTMANLPGGEMFVTPEYLKGTFVGDVVISIDQSYALDEKDPLVITATKKGYRVVRGPKKIIDKLNEKKKDAWKQIIQTEKSKSVPQEITDLKKKNFKKIGEFAINTNPKAQLCDYLIVNEKIAKMIHIALGSGFEPDRATEYHTDIVINAPRQKLDIYGVNGESRHWIMKKGKFVI